MTSRLLRNKITEDTIRLKMSKAYFLLLILLTWNMEWNLVGAAPKEKQAEDGTADIKIDWGDY